MGGYNRNYLLRVKRIQEINNQWEGGYGRTYAWMWRNKVYDTYPCSYNTYISMMGINVNVEIKRLEERLKYLEYEANQRQLTLF